MKLAPMVPMIQFYIVGKHFSILLLRAILCLTHAVAKAWLRSRLSHY